MTTMDSDSESQDSDEGRRFRFEATRKDAMTNLQYYQKDISPPNNASRRCRRRSRDRVRSTRRKNRNTSVRAKEHTNDYEEPPSCKEKTKLSRDLESKNLQKHTKTCQTSRVSQTRDFCCRDTRISKRRDEKRKRARDRHRENKSSNKIRKYSRERDKLSERRKSCSLQNQKPCSEKIENHVKDKLNQLGLTNNEEKPDHQDCNDLNLSDFDIVSDTEEKSYNSDKIIELANEAIEKEDDHIQEKDKVKLRNFDKSSGSHLSNPDDFSDFLLAATSTKTIGAHSNHTQLCKNQNTSFTNFHLKKEPEAATNNLVDIDDEMYGPALPPNIGTKSFNTPKLIGPSLPNYLSKSGVQSENDLIQYLKRKQNATGGPALLDTIAFKRNEKDKNDDFVGPLPADYPSLNCTLVQKQLEYRAHLIKRQLAEIDDRNTAKREEWMIELPPTNVVRLGAQCGPRKFRMAARPDLSDRSDWTDTPADRAKKKLIHYNSSGQKEEPQTILTAEPTRRKERSLLDLHQKKLHGKKKRKEKEAKKSGTLPERRPFDRNIDLQVNRLNGLRKKSILLKAAALDDRFSVGRYE